MIWITVAGGPCALRNRAEALKAPYAPRAGAVVQRSKLSGSLSAGSRPERSRHTPARVGRGGIDDQVDPSEATADVLERGEDRRLVGDVHLHRVRSNHANPLEGLGRASTACHIPAVGEQPLDDRETQIAGADDKGSGHQALAVSLAADSITGSDPSPVPLMRRGRLVAAVAIGTSRMGVRAVVVSRCRC